MRTVPRKRKTMSQKLDSKRKRNAASKRRKRAKIAQEKGKSVVRSMPDPAEDSNSAASGEEDSDEEISSEVSFLNLFIVCYSPFLGSPESIYISVLYPYQKIKPGMGIGRAVQGEAVLGNW